MVNSQIFSLSNVFLNFQMYQYSLNFQIAVQRFKLLESSSFKRTFGESMAQLKAATVLAIDVEIHQ